MLKVETGELTPWNFEIEEQRCIKYGKVCTIFVRGSYDGGTNPFPANCSLFSLPWRPLNLYLHPVDSLTMWRGKEPSNTRPINEYCQYNSQYNLIILPENVLNCKYLAFSYTYICE